MEQNLAQFDERLTRVERDLENLKSSQAAHGSKRDWKKIVGTVVHPAVYDKICRLGAEFRRRETEP